MLFRPVLQKLIQGGHTPSLNTIILNVNVSTAEIALILRYHLAIFKVIYARCAVFECLLKHCLKQHTYKFFF